MAYVAMWPELYCVFYCLSNNYAIAFITTKMSPIRHKFQDQYLSHRLILRRSVRRRHHRPRIKSARSVVEIKPATFRTAAIDDDKD